MSTSFGIRLRFKLWLCHSLLQIHLSEQWFHQKLKDDNSTIFSSVKHIEHVCMLNRVQLCNSMDCSLPGFSVHGTLQARILEWIAISFSRGSSQPRDRLLHWWVDSLSLSHLGLPKHIVIVLISWNCYQDQMNLVEWLERIINWLMIIFTLL